MINGGRAGMKKLLSYGDSIAFGYKDALAQFVSHQYAFYTKEGILQAASDLNVPSGTNCGDSRMTLAYLQKAQEELTQFDAIVFNCGKHDIKVNLKTGERQVPEKEYRENMQKIAEIIRDKTPSPFYVNCTKVFDDVHNTPENIKLNLGVVRYDADGRRYNEAAAEIMDKLGIPVIDLYALSEKWGKEALRDHVHYHPTYAAMQAAYIAGAVLTIR